MPIRVVRNITGARRFGVLAFHLARFSLKKDSLKTYSGAAWWLAEPAMNAAIYWFLIVVVFQARREGFLPFALLGLVVWRWVQQSVIIAGNSIRNNAALMRSIHYPKFMFVLKDVLVQTFHFLFGLVVVIAAYQFLGYPVSWYYLLLPVQLVVVLFVIFGYAMFVSAIVPFVPDLHQLLRHVFRLLLFASGVLYGAEDLPAKFMYHFLYYLNPFVPLVEGFRDLLLFERVPDLYGVFYALGVGLGFAAIGCWLHKKYNRVYPRIVAM